MRLRISNDFHGGNEANFPLVLAELLETYPCWAAPAEALRLDSPLVRRRHWCSHILDQLEFSYTTQAYLRDVVLPVLESLPSETDLPLLADLRRHVSDLANGLVPISNETMSVVASAATEFQVLVERDRLQLIERGMNQLGRYLFSDGQNLNKVTRWLNWTALVVHRHLDIASFLTRFREALSAVHLRDHSATLKDRTLRELEGIRDDIVTAEEVVVAFFCPAIKMHTPTIAIGNVSFYSGDTLLKSNVVALAPEAAVKRIQEVVMRRPFEAIAVVHVAGHPRHLNAAVTKSAEELRTIDGFICTQRATYAAPRTHGYVAWAPTELKRCEFRSASATVRNSLVLMSSEGAAELALNYGFLASPLSDDTTGASDIVRRVRRVFDGFRTSAFQARSGEYTHAFGALWAVCELLLADHGSQNRGNEVSRRLSALLTAPNGLRDDEDVAVTRSDVLRFAHAVEAGETVLISTDDTRALLKQAASTEAPTDVSEAFRVLAAEPGSLFEWRQDELEAQINAGPDRTKANETIRRIREHVGAMYRLRNDLVHSAYANDPASHGAYEDLREMLAVTLLTVVSNLTRSDSHKAFLAAVDLQFILLTEGPTEEAVRIKAHQLWARRERPVGDSWKDWFDAEADLKGWI